MLERHFTKKLIEWKNSTVAKALLIDGARQVGKTSTIEDFAKNNYENVIKIDFVETPEAVQLIGEAKNLNDLLLRITSIAGRPISGSVSEAISDSSADRTDNSNRNVAFDLTDDPISDSPACTISDSSLANTTNSIKALLFFDEIQKCGDVVTWMRYLADDDRFDVIFSGSMLGVEAYNYRSLPVGTIDIYEMFPMDFEEFSWACGVDASIWDVVRECFANTKPVPDFIHEKLIELFYRYVLVGGMPEAVQVFVSTSDTQATRARQASILDNYRADITRYVDDKMNAQRIKTIFNSIPSQLNKENKRFIVADIDKRRRFMSMQSDFDWLVSAGVAISVKRVTQASFPLGIDQDISYFKLYMNDVGLLFSTFSNVSVQDIVAMRNTINFGSAFENAVAQELRATGDASIFYYNRRGTGEVDFLINRPGCPEVMPIEVKSGGNSHAHAALNHLLDVKNYGVRGAVVLHVKNVEAGGEVSSSRSGKSATSGRDNAHLASSAKSNVVYLPIYMAFLLRSC